MSLAGAGEGSTIARSTMKVEEPPAHTRDALEGDTKSGIRLAVVSGLLFFSGIGALIFETLWLRLSGLAFGNSVWAAALILSSFMAGLALGNAIAASSRVRRWRPLRLYAALELAVAFSGCTIVFGLPLLGEWLRPIWQTLWNYQPMLISLRFILSFLILLVPTTAMVLAGIGLGSLGWGAFHRRASDNLLPILLLLAAIVALLCYLFFPGELIQ